MMAKLEADREVSVSQIKQYSIARNVGQSLGQIVCFNNGTGDLPLDV